MAWQLGFACHKLEVLILVVYSHHEALLSAAAEANNALRSVTVTAQAEDAVVVQKGVGLAVHEVVQRPS